MPETYKLLIASSALSLFSFLLSILLGDSFGAAQVVMAILASSSPLVVDYLYQRTLTKMDAEREEILILQSNLKSLEAEVSRINLALKLRN